MYPRYLKFSIASGYHYLYCIDTNNILRVSDVVYSIIDDFVVLDRKDLLVKYSGEFDEKDLREAVDSLSSLKNDGLPRSSALNKTPQVVGITLDDKRVFSIEEFLQNYCRMLTLEITHACNLNCEYCSYGKHYPRYRSHGNRTIDVSIAEQAIKYHLDIPLSGRTVAFYGGEPLLEFNLIRRLVLFAEEYCRDSGKEPPSFSLTTNGTLLNDEIIHFLAEHKFSVLVSIDGNRESHDRYRRYKSDGRGSFDDIEKNLRRFIELYPDYPGRGFSLTLTATNDFLRTNQFVKKYHSHFPVLMVSFVNSVAIADTTKSACNQKDCSEQSPCVKFSSEEFSGSPPDFDNWTDERLAEYHKGYNMFMSLLLTSPEEARREYPIFAYLFDNKFRGIHTRQIYLLYSFKVACSCIPGAVRLYCDIDGNYYPCEKVETSEPLRIGNVSSGIDAERVKKMIAFMGSVTDCEDCSGKHLCSICPSRITQTDTGESSSRLIQKECEELAERLLPLLKEYTEIMEKDEHFFDGVYSSNANSEKSTDWLTDVSFVLDKEEICRGCVHHVNFSQGRN